MVCGRVVDGGTDCRFLSDFSKRRNVHVVTIATHIGYLTQLAHAARELHTCTLLKLPGQRVYVHVVTMATGGVFEGVCGRVGGCFGGRGVQGV